MPEDTKRKTVTLTQEQIDAIEQTERKDPVLRGRGFSAALRWVINKFFGLEEPGEGEEDEQD